MFIHYAIAIFSSSTLDSSHTRSTISLAIKCMHLLASSIMSSSSEAKTYTGEDGPTPTAEDGGQAPQATNSSASPPALTSTARDGPTSTAQDGDLFQSGLHAAAATAGYGNRYNNKIHGTDNKGKGNLLNGKSKSNDNGKGKSKDNGSKGKGNDNEPKGKGKGDEIWFKGKGNDDEPKGKGKDKGDEPKGKGKGKDYNEICQVVRWLYMTAHKQAKIIDELRDQIRDIEDRIAELQGQLHEVEADQDDARRERNYWRRNGWWN